MTIFKKNCTCMHSPLFWSHQQRCTPPPPPPPQQKFSKSVWKGYRAATIFKIRDWTFLLVYKNVLYKKGAIQLLVYCIWRNFVIKFNPLFFSFSLSLFSFTLVRSFWRLYSSFWISKSLSIKTFLINIVWNYWIPILSFLFIRY